MRRLGPLSAILGVAVLVVLLIAVFSPWPKTAVAQPRPDNKSTDKPKPAAQPAVPSVAAPGTVLYTVTKGDSTHTLIRKFWADSSYMTNAEFLGAVRTANPDKIKGDWPKVGETLVIPGMNGPIVEKPVPMAKDAEVRAIYLTH